MKHETQVKKSYMAASIASGLEHINDWNYISQFLDVYLSKLSVKELKEAEKDIERLKDYIKNQSK